MRISTAPPMPAGRHPLGADLVATAILYAAALVLFASAGTGAHVYRYDCGDAVAYPASDALNAYASAIAVLEGDGFANWQTSSRWTLCKIGWKAMLVPLAWAFERDPARIQIAVTVLLATIAPAFYALARQVIHGRFAVLGAFAVTMLFLATPLERSWWFTRTLLTEGPTLLLVLVVCTLALRAARTPCWSSHAGLALGLVAGALALVRSQSRFGIAALVAVLALVAARSPAGRRYLAATALGLVAVVAPVYVKTSVHLGAPYLGTEICSLRAVLNWTEAGLAAGGTIGLPAAGADEARLLDVLSGRAREAARRQLERPGATLRPGVDRFLFATTGGLSRRLGTGWSTGVAVAGAVLLVAGLAALASRVGLAALAPFAFAAGYFLPNAIYSLFWIRHGVPISWLGAFALAAIGAALARPADPRPPPSAERPRRFAPLALGVVAASVVATVAMLATDAARPAEREPIEIPVPGLAAPLEGHLLLPVVISPGEGCATGDATLEPGPRSETSFLLARSWKRDGRFSLQRVRVPSLAPSSIENGRRVRLLPAPAP